MPLVSRWGYISYNTARHRFLIPSSTRADGNPIRLSPAQSQLNKTSWCFPDLLRPNNVVNPVHYPPAFENSITASFAEVEFVISLTYCCLIIKL